MTIASHLQELRRKHETLSEMVEQAQRSPASDDAEDRRTEEAETEAEGRNQPPRAGVDLSRRWRVPPAPHPP